MGDTHSFIHGMTLIAKIRAPSSYHLKAFGPSTYPVLELSRKMCLSYHIAYVTEDPLMTTKTPQVKGSFHLGKVPTRSSGTEELVVACLKITETLLFVGSSLQILARKNFLRAATPSHFPPHKVRFRLTDQSFSPQSQVFKVIGLFSSIHVFPLHSPYEKIIIVSLPWECLVV